MLREYGIPVRGRRCVVLGRSNIVGKPMAMLLLQQDGTVTVCHSKTPGLAGHTRRRTSWCPLWAGWVLSRRVW